MILFIIVYSSTNYNAYGDMTYSLRKGPRFLWFIMQWILFPTSTLLHYDLANASWWQFIAVFLSVAYLPRNSDNRNQCNRNIISNEEESSDFSCTQTVTEQKRENMLMLPKIWKTIKKTAMNYRDRSKQSRKLKEVMKEHSQRESDRQNMALLKVLSNSQRKIIVQRQDQEKRSHLLS